MNLSTKRYCRVCRTFMGFTRDQHDSLTCPTCHAVYRLDNRQLVTLYGGSLIKRRGPGPAVEPDAAAMDRLIESGQITRK